MLLAARWLLRDGGARQQEDDAIARDALEHEIDRPEEPAGALPEGASLIACRLVRARPH